MLLRCYINNITIKQLKVFSAVSRAESLTSAAAELFVTKAAVSIALQSLEAQLQQPLFDRVKNRLLINAQGRKLQPLADELLQRMQAIEALFDANQYSGLLRIGASVTVGNHLLPSMLASFLPATKSQRPELTIANTADLSNKILAYELDVALDEGRVHSDRLNVIPWLDDQMYVIASVDHPLAKIASLSDAQLAGQSWVLREASSGTREQFDQRLSALLPSWSLGLEFNSNEAVINAVAAGIGLGFMSNLSVAQAIENNKLVRLNRIDSCRRQLYLVYAKDRYVSPLLQYFIDYTLAWQPQN
ncbi:MAG: LysR substrate-binding domain-containing protein [Pseudomonadales bacterium]|nr:LysR substrate-binding domain-containing protein [Pseudomonadales bacterium]